MSEQQRFLASETPLLPAEECLFQVIPVPYEATVSYGQGTALGPQAILDASWQLELWNGYNTPGTEGIYTCPAVDCTGDAETVLGRIESAVAKSLEARKDATKNIPGVQNTRHKGVIPFVLGGEHSLTLGTLRALKKHYGHFGILHFDAHADLRHEYEGSIYSHASVMRRAVDDLGLDLFQVGVRSLSLEEKNFREEKKLAYLDARSIGKDEKLIHTSTLPENFPQNIFVSFDVDALDSSIMPATGTPEPGGLLWWQALNAAENLLKNRCILGVDVVELAPMPGLVAPEYATARLCYELMGLCCLK